MGTSPDRGRVIKEILLVKRHIIAAVDMLGEITDRHIAESPHTHAVHCIGVHLLDGIIVAETAAYRLIAIL